MVKSSLWTAGGSVLSLLVATVATVAVARFLGPTEFGQYALYALLLGLLPALTDLGFTHTIARRASLSIGSGDVAALRHAVGMQLGWSLARLPLAAAATLIVLPLTEGVVAVTASLLSMVGTSSAQLLGARADAKVAVMLNVIGNGGSSVVAIVLASQHASPATVYSYPLLATALAAAALLLVADKDVSRMQRVRPRLPRIPRADVSFALGSWFTSQLGNFVSTRTEILFFKAGQQLSRGQFTAGLTIAQRSTTAVDALFGPLSAALIIKGSGSQSELDVATGRSLRLTGLLCLAVMPGLTAASVFLAYPLFGKGFAGIGLSAVLPLTLASVFSTALQPVFSYYFARKIVLPNTVGAVLGVIADVALAVVLIPPYGLLGAVIASIGSDVALLGTLLWFLIRDGRLRQPVLHHIKLLLVACGATTVVVVGAGLTLNGTTAPVRSGGGLLAAGLLTVVLLNRFPVLADEDRAVVATLAPGRLSGAISTVLARTAPAPKYLQKCTDR